MLNATIEKLETQLDSFDHTERQAALDKLIGLAGNGEIELPAPTDEFNLHCHTFFSYSCYGYSPSKLAWLGKKKGLFAMGTVDFDVLDALEEFLNACQRLNIKAAAGLETRVFIPEFETREINSPGEPGIAYHVGTGFPTADLTYPQNEFLDNLRKTAQQRNLALMQRVNQYLDPVQLDYEKDVLPLTPSANPTERHICLAYARKAAAYFNDNEKLAQFWNEKLSTDVESLPLPESRDLLNTIRAKTMKKGGPGYVQPDKSSFPLLADTNRFILQSGAIPTLAWLNGLSAGEQAIEELLDVAQSTGTAAVAIIPDRNFTPGVEDKKLENLYAFAKLADSRHLPIFIGTEMNSPGQKFVDDLHSKELSPLLPLFLEGTYIAYAHSALQQNCSLGYISEWAKANFESVADKNTFFAELGNKLSPKNHHKLTEFDTNTKPEQILKIAN